MPGERPSRWAALPRPGRGRRRPGGDPGPGRGGWRRWWGSARGAPGATSVGGGAGVAMTGQPTGGQVCSPSPCTRARVTAWRPTLTWLPSRCPVPGCPRLVAWREEVGREKRAAFRDEEYWARPVPGFGDPDAVGRRGPGSGRPRGQPHRAHVHRRPFRRLPLRRRCGAPGSPTSPPATTADDGLVLTGAWITSPVRCAPPANKPTPGGARHVPTLPRARARAAHRGPGFLVPSARSATRSD
jgi:hypothetical protein